MELLPIFVHDSMPKYAKEGTSPCVSYWLCYTAPSTAFDFDACIENKVSAGLSTIHQCAEHVTEICNLSMRGSTGSRYVTANNFY